MTPANTRRPKIIHRMSERGFSYEEIALDNVLSAKLGGPIPDACLNRAERALAALKDQYLEWVFRDLDLMTELLDEGLGSDDDAAHEGVIDQLRRLTHDMRGQGGTFGYPLVSMVASALNDILKMPHLPWAQQVQLIRLHADVIRRILNNRIEGEGGKAGPMIVARLKTLTEGIIVGQPA